VTAADTTDAIDTADSRPATPLSRHLLALARPGRDRLAVVAGCVLAAAVVELVPPLVVRHVIDHNLTTGHTSGLGRAGLLYLGAAVAVAVLTATYGYLAASVAQQALAGLRGRLFAHLLALPTEYHDRTPIGDSISRATADVEAIDDLFSSSAATLLGETVRLVTVSVAMFLLSPRLTAVAALVVPPLVLITRVLRARVRDAERDTRVAVGELNTQLAEDLAGAEVIRAFGRQAGFVDRFRTALRGWLRAANRSVAYNAYYAPALGVLAASATALLLWLGGRDAFGGLGVTVGTLTAFVLLFARFFAPLVNLGDEWNAVQAALAGAERVFAVLDSPPTGPADTPPTITPEARRLPLDAEPSTPPQSRCARSPSATSPTGRCSATSRSRCARASTSPSSGALAPASRVFCRCWPGCTGHPAARSRSVSSTPPGSMTSDVGRCSGSSHRRSPCSAAPSPTTSPWATPP